MDRVGEGGRFGEPGAEIEGGTGRNPTPSVLDIACGCCRSLNVLAYPRSIEFHRHFHHYSTSAGVPSRYDCRLGTGAFMVVVAERSALRSSLFGLAGGPDRWPSLSFGLQLRPAGQL